MKLRVTITWQYEPSDFFEVPYKEIYEGVEYQIIEGSIKAILDKEEYEADLDFTARLRKHVEALFEGIRLQSHVDFRIMTGSIEKDRPNGGKDIIISPNPAGAVAMTGHLDIKIIDKYRNVVADTRNERIKEKIKFAELVASKRGSDSTIDTMLNSYSQAVKDPNNELVYIFEIREALVSRFGDKNAARNAIGISSNDWNTLGRLANNEPLKQGRHRGKKATSLRDATQAELEEARAIARNMILGYLNQLS